MVKPLPGLRHLLLSCICQNNTKTCRLLVSVGAHPLLGLDNFDLFSKTFENTFSFHLIIRHKGNFFFFSSHLVFMAGASQVKAPIKTFNVWLLDSVASVGSISLGWISAFDTAGDNTVYKSYLASGAQLWPGSDLFSSSLENWRTQGSILGPVVLLFSLPRQCQIIHKHNNSFYSYVGEHICVSHLLILRQVLDLLDRYQMSGNLNFSLLEPPARPVKIWDSVDCQPLTIWKDGRSFQMTAKNMHSIIWIGGAAKNDWLLIQKAIQKCIYIFSLPRC